MDPSEEPDRGASPRGSVKRRKLRKGTRSCWECKRRKIRCMFATPGDATCIGCQHRHVSCVPQDLAGDSVPVRRETPSLGERISRIEDFMNVFFAQHQADSDTSTACVDRLWSVSSFPSPDSHPVEAETNVVSRSAEADTVSSHLFAALPSPEDVRILLRESSRPSRYTHLVNTQPHSRLTLESLAAPYPVAQPPLPSMHPVLLARLMLIFAITLQSPSGEKAQGLSEAPEALMQRLVSAVKTWVTTKEEMHRSIECLVCIVLEGVYETNCGNLRRAWAVFRRAMTVAQLMGLHCSSVPRLLHLDPELDVDARFLWFRIVFMDRYLSLLLGLPQGSTDKTMGDASMLQNEPPLGKFERLLTVIAGRVLGRNETAFTPDQLSTTKSIDAELLNVSRSMPLSFWKVPSFHNLALGSPETLLETVRLAAHVYYYGLLIQLHLPYMMQLGDNPVQEYSRSTCVNSSREIMTRFVVHRTFNPNSSCSRPVDFFALLAAMTLLLAHLDTHRHKDTPNVLAHQRLSDRAMLKQSLDRMDAIKNLNKDPVTAKSADVIRRLMDMEADAFDGGTYTTNSVEDATDSREDEDGLRLTIPCLGVIKIFRQGPISRDLWTENALASSSRTTLQEPPHAPLPDDQSLCPMSDVSAVECYLPLVAGVDDWTFQGVEMAFFDNLTRGALD